MSWALRREGWRSPVSIMAMRVALTRPPVFSDRSFWVHGRPSANWPAAARQAFDAQNAKETKTRIQTLIQTITASTSTQRRREAFDLVLLNAQRLLASSSR